MIISFGVVISLPSGVFQPYSGVKTSILFLDRKRAKKTDEILFIDVGADGFDLGATRRRVDRNDLPEAFNILCAWRNEEKKVSELAHWVSREKIREDGDYNLSGNRYKEVEERSNCWPMMKLKDLFLEIKNGKNVKQFDGIGKYKVSRIQTIANGEFDLTKTKQTNDSVLESDFLKEGDILFSHINSIKHLAKTAIFKGIKSKVVHGANLLRLRPNLDKITPKYALCILKSNEFINNAKKICTKSC